MSVIGSLLLIAAIMTGSIYVVAVIDGVTGSRLSGVRQPVGPWLMPPAQAARMALQRRTMTERPDAEAWALAPPLLAGLAAVALTAIPFSASTSVADIPSGIVLFGAAMVQVMVAVFLHGWGSNSVFPLMGAFRMAAAALSFGIPFSLVLITTAIPAESLSVGTIVASQQDLWNVIRQPLGLPVYLITALGFAFWGPMNLSDATDLAGGTSTEASGTALLAWRAARAAILVSVSSMGAAAFLGGYLGPWLPGWAWMAFKTMGLAVLMIWSSHRLARVRIESVVLMGWTVLLPVALVDVFVSGALAL